MRFLPTFLGIYFFMNWSVNHKQILFPRFTGVQAYQRMIFCERDAGRHSCLVGRPQSPARAADNKTTQNQLQLTRKDR